MSNKSFESIDFAEQLEKIAVAVNDVARDCQGDPLALLTLLRRLEFLHRAIRDGAFQDSLPDNRRQLYSLLKDIESEGGWPYIERMRLRAFLGNLRQEVTEENRD
ncbi:hypothetical protein IQ244_29010 [Nostoc sp. LEGE 06077]|uniref:hypothetical protein n=1 Tax=Nostoc sp. LEGE 06077 TaxID=915325 RepID=UPI001881DB76|nr:hypothetical protein [Nostoc sp. LEGE 06077]MBE9210470.1 hypothetical protein [Nostoc sp. LEGE 06077]